MPIYEYLCSACGHHEEKLQQFSDSPLDLCPNCGKPEIRRLISSTQFQLKGSGWYVTDHRVDKKSATASDSKDKPQKKSSEE